MRLVPKHWSALVRRARTSAAHRMREPLAGESGIALVVALGTVVVMSISTTTALYYTQSNSNSSYGSSSSQSAYTLAEAGVNDALSILAGATDPTNTATLATSEAAAPTVTLPSKGFYKYWGVLSGTTWTLYGKGTLAAAGETAARSRTLRRIVEMNSTSVGSFSGLWDRIYSDLVGACSVTLNAGMNIPSNFTSKGDVCLNDSSITGATTNVDIGGKVTISTAAGTEGPNSPSLGAGWTTPTNVYTSNSIYATNVIAAGATGATEDVTGFGNAVPAGATILGITASVIHKASACCNAVQTISETGAPTGGTFKISGTPPGGTVKTSVAIAFNAPAATVQTALLTMYGNGNVACAGGPLPTGVVCTFQGAYASMAVTLMSLNLNSLTGGTTPAPAFANTTVGSVGAIQDATVSLLKAGLAVGSNKAVAANWGTANATVAYGTATDLWGTTWTAAEVNAANFGVRVIAKNVAAASATASLDYVSITIAYQTAASINAGIGSAAIPVARANITGVCKLNTNSAHAPCTAADHVWPSTNGAAALNLTRPTINWAFWYANAAPGPMHPCTTSTGIPPSFDNNTTYDGSQMGAGLDQEITTEGASYTCQSKNANGDIIGELSWNTLTRVLTIKGTIFFDGSAVFHDHDVAAWHYHGRGVIYIAGKWHNDEPACAGSATGNCRNDGMPAWNTNTDLMVLVVGGKLAAGSDDFDFHRTNSAFQGAIYGTHTCKIHEQAYMQGPLNCGDIDFSGDSPSFFAWPPMPDAAEGQIYSTGTSSDIQLVVGAQSE